MKIAQIRYFPSFSEHLIGGSQVIFTNEKSDIKIESFNLGAFEGAVDLPQDSMQRISAIIKLITPHFEDIPIKIDGFMEDAGLQRITLFIEDRSKSIDVDGSAFLREDLYQVEKLLTQLATEFLKQFLALAEIHLPRQINNITTKHHVNNKINRS